MRVPLEGEWEHHLGESQYLQPNQKERVTFGWSHVQLTKPFLPQTAKQFSQLRAVLVRVSLTHVLVLVVTCVS